MSSVDNRIVQMQFDNQQFEKGVQTSIKSLDALKKGLNLNASAKSLNELGKVGKSFSLEGIAANVEHISQKFSAMGIIGITALQNIANQAIQTGGKMLKALTIEPVMTGFSEYETKVNAIQTILSNTSSKGTTMADVTRVIDELNTYADKTIYNFAEMTRNIGTFTAAGVGLEESAAAIQGIANLAAASGSSSQQASTAMYQLSQALAAGTVKLMDWNSVVNAGMGGQKFQEALKETAREMKKTNKDYKHDVDALIKKNGSFRESLQAGWITADVLNATLQKFTVEGAREYAQSMVECGQYTQEQADALIAEAIAMEDAATKVKTFTQLWDTLKESAQSGWSKSWELVVGDFEEAKASLTEISNIVGDMINSSAEKRNAVLFESLSSGWKRLVNEGVPDAEFFQDTIIQVASKYDESIAKMVADSDSFEASLKNGWLTTDILTESIGEYAKKLNELTEEQREEYGITQEQIDRFNELHTAIQNGEISIEEFVESFTKLSGREKIFESLKESIRFISELIQPISAAFDSIFGIDAAQLTGMIDGLLSFTQSLKVSETTAENLQRTFSGLFAIFDMGGKAVRAIAKGFGDLIMYLAPAGSSFLEFTAGIGDYLVGLNDSVDATNIFGTTVDKVTTAIKNILSGLKSFGEVVSSLFSGAELTGSLERFAPLIEKIRERFQPLVALGGAVGKVFEGLGKVFNAILPIFASLGTVIGDALNDLATWISNGIQKIDFNAVFDVLNSGLFAAILAGVAQFVDNLNDIFDDGLDGVPFIDKIKSIFGGVKDALEAWQQSLKSDVIQKLAMSIGIVAAALVALSLVDSAKLNNAVGAMAGIFVELVAAMAVIEQIPTLTKIGNLTKMAPGLIGLATGVLILSGAVAILAQCDWEGLVVGLTGVAGCLAGLSLFSKFSDISGMKMSSGVGLIGLATSIIILGQAVKTFSEMDGNALLQGVTAVGLVLAELAAFTSITSGSSGMISTAIGMTIMAASMLVLSKGIDALGKMDAGVLEQGLLGLAGALTMVTVAMRFMPNNMAGIGFGLLEMSASILMLTASLTTLGNMGIGQIQNALLSMGGALMLLSAAAQAMRNSVAGAGAMLVMAGAMLVLTPALKSLSDMSIAEIATSLGVMAGAFVILGVAGYALAPVAPIILTLSGSLALLGVACIAVGAGVLAFSAGLSALAVSGTAGAAAIVAIVSSLVSLIPMLLTQIGNGIVAFAQAIGNGAEAIGVAVTQLVTAIVTALTTCIPLVVNGVMQLCLSILTSLAAYAGPIATAGVQVIIGLMTALSAQIPALVNAGIQLMVSFINGMADGIRQNTPAILAAVSNLMSSIVEFALSALAALVSGIPGIGAELEAGILSLKDSVRSSLAPGDMQATGAEAMSGMATGIQSGTAEVQAAGVAVGEQGASGISTVLPLYNEAGANAGAGFVDGIGTEQSASQSAGQGLAEKGASGAASKNDSFWSAGSNAGAGFVQGISSQLSAAEGAGASLANAAYQAAMRTLDEHSPSRVMMEVGAFGSEGFIIGLLSLMSSVKNAGASIGDTAIDSMSSTMSRVVDLLSVDLDAAPTIRPILDTSNIESGLSSMDRLFSATRTLDLGSTRVKAATVAGTMSSHDEIGKTVTTPATTVNNNFTQNNYSPKALSRVEIYRQTNNLFAITKEVLKKA